MPPLSGRVALVTGVSRRAGIGYAIANRLEELGASVFRQGWSAHDEGQPWGAEPRVDHFEADLANPGAHAVELLAPELDGARRRLDRPAPTARLGEVHVLVPVVEAPVRRQLRERPVRGLEHVRPVVVHEGRVVPKAVLGEEVEGALARLPARRAVALGADADPLQRLEPALEVGALGAGV